MDWQVTVIRRNTESPAGQQTLRTGAHLDADRARAHKMFLAEAGTIATELSRYAIRRGPTAAWVALDWSGESGTFELSCLGPALYNGVSGIGLFLAAHAAVAGSAPSAELALAAVVQIRKELRSRDAASLARSLGVGGGVGLGSIVYALAVMSQHLRDVALLADAHEAAALITDDLIAADTRLDILGGSAGAILGLLRLYRDSRSSDVLARAVRCGEHLLRQPRTGPDGCRTWAATGANQRRLNGMSHGAAGYAYALAALSEATGREEFASAAAECIAFENAGYDAQHHDWPDLREGNRGHRPSQWCHGAPGIGLSRIAMTRLGQPGATPLTADIHNAAVAVERGWPGQRQDTLCCGALGSVEFFGEAAAALGRSDLADLASRSLESIVSAATRRGDYRWIAGNRRFNPGMFRGLAGIGYTALRRTDATLPNILLWQ